MSNRTNLRCGDAKPYLSALADGEVAEPLRSIVEAHAATCASCGAILAHHRAVNNVFAALPTSAPSPAVLDRVLTARATQRTMEPARRESMLRRRQAALGLRRIATLLTLPQAEPAPVLAAPRPRSFWRQTAFPALAALVLISFAFAAFSRVAPGLISSNISHVATPTPLGDAYEQAQTYVQNAVHEHPIAFTAEIPWSLPSGATFSGASVDPATGSLDIVWNLTNTLAQLHVSEAPVALVNWDSSYRILVDSPLSLAWQLPGKAAWRAATSTTDTARLAVVQDNATFSIAVDVAFPNDADAAHVDPNTQQQAMNVLRFASLSMDAIRFAMPAIAGVDALSSVVHYTAQSGSSSNRTVSDVYVDLAGNHARVTVSDASGVLYVDYISGTTATRYDPRSNVYGRLPTLSTSLGDAPLDSLTAAFFNFANSHLIDGELWYIGTGTWKTHSVYKLALTNASYSTMVYVDTSSNQVVGAEVNYTVALNTGATGLPTYFIHNSCLNYTSVEYLTSAPANTFTSPQGYFKGAPRASAACAA
jgi:anti-sigma factor RsiW